MGSDRHAVFRSPLLWVIVLALVVRLALLFRYADTSLLVPRGDDMKFYNDWALRILQGQFTDGKAFYGMPGYAWILAALYKIAGFNPFVPGLVQVLLDAGTAALIFVLGQRLFAPVRFLSKDCEPWIGTSVGFIAAVGWVFFLPAQSFSIILMPTAYLLFAFWGLVLWIATTQSASPARPWPLIGLTIGLVAVIIATILFLIPLVIIQIMRRVGRDEGPFRGWRQRLTAVALLMAGVFAGTSPAWIHNYFIAHEAVMLSAHSGFNLYIGNNPLANGYPKIPPGLRASQEGLLKDSITVAEKAENRRLTRAEVSQFWSEKAKDWISENRRLWVGLLGTKLRNFWNAYSYDDISIIKILRADGILPPGLTFGMVSALALPGLLIGIFGYPRSRWVAAAVLLHLCALLPVFITERYRLCAVPGLLLFGALFLVQLWRWLLASQWPAAAGAMTATAVSAWAVSDRPSDIGNWSLDPYNVGIRAYEAAQDAGAEGNPQLQRNELDRSLASLQLALAYVPDNAEINFALGNSWLAKGDTDRARRFYHRTLQLNGRHSDAWNNLGVVALQGQDLPLAIRCFETAIALEPADAKTHFLLAQAQYEAGNLGAARAAIKQALKFRPEQREFLNLKSELDRRSASKPK